MSRRLIAIIATAALLFTFVACGNGDIPPADSGSSTSPPVSGGDSGSSGEVVDQSDWVELDLNFASFLPETESGVYEQKLFRDALERYMPGKVTWTEYWAGTLLTEESMYEGIVAGTADYGYVTPMSGDFPLSLLWSQAAVGVQSAAGATAAYTDWVINEQPEEFSEAIFLWGFANGPSAFMAHNPIRTVADLKGLQLYANTGMTETVNALGAVGVSMTNGEVFEAVRSGLVDGAYSTLGSQARNGIIPDLVSDVCVVPMGTAVGGYCINKEKFNTMPPSQQEAFLAAFSEACFEYYVPQIEEIRILTDPINLPAAEECDFTVLSPGTPEYEEFYNMVYPVTEAYIEDLNARGFDGQKEFETIQKYLKKWETDWFAFDRYMEPFLAASDGTLEDWLKTDYALPETPKPGKVA